MSTIATWSPQDAALGILVPLGLVSAVETGLVIDLDPNGPAVAGTFTLADLVERGPTRSQLEPTGKGAAYLANGGINPESAAEIIAALVERWPAVVLRCPGGGTVPSGAISVLPLLPAPYTLVAEGRVVYQRCAYSPKDRPRGVVLPIPSGRTIRNLFNGALPPRRDRWIRALGDVWTLA